MDYERKGGRERERGEERKGDGERGRFGVSCTAVTKLCSEWEREEGKTGWEDSKRGKRCNPQFLNVKDVILKESELKSSQN